MIHGIKEYVGLNFAEVETKNHKEKCWIEGDLNRPIAFETMIENPDVLAYLSEISLPIVI